MTETHHMDILIESDEIEIAISRTASDTHVYLKLRHKTQRLSNGDPFMVGGPVPTADLRGALDLLERGYQKK